jgi:hypothetical protein
MCLNYEAWSKMGHCRSKKTHVVIAERQAHDGNISKNKTWTQILKRQKQYMNFLAPLSLCLDYELQHLYMTINRFPRNHIYCPTYSDRCVCDSNISMFL